MNIAEWVNSVVQSNLSNIFNGIITVILVVGGPLAANYIWNKYKSPKLTLTEESPQKIRFASSGYRYQLEVRNEGRQRAQNCQAELWLIGENLENGVFIRLYQPIGWINPHIDTSLDPEELDLETDIAEGDRKSLYIGHTSSILYNYFFPNLFGEDAHKIFTIDIPDKNDYIERLHKDDYHPADGFDAFDEEEKKRQVPFDYLISTDWEQAVLRMDSENTRQTVYQIDFSQEGPGHDPKFTFSKKARINHILQIFQRYP